MNERYLGGDDVPSLQDHPGLSDASKGTGVPESRGEVGVQDPEHHDGARDTRWRDDRMTGRRSHGRLSALNGVVHQGRRPPDRGRPRLQHLKSSDEPRSAGVLQRRSLMGSNRKPRRVDRRIPQQRRYSVQAPLRPLQA